MLKIKYIKLGTLLTMISTPLIALSCEKNKFSQTPKEYINTFSKEYAKTTHAKIDVSNINREELLSLPGNLNNYYGYGLMAGGFGELRKYYRDNGISWHLGQDIMVPETTKVTSPFDDAKIINAIWTKKTLKNGINNIAEGIGGNITLKVKIENLNINKTFKELLYFESMTIHNYKLKNERIEKKFFTLPKLKFVKNGLYKEPTKTDLIPYGFNPSSTTTKKTLTLTTKGKYDQFVNNYNPSNARKASKLFLIESSKYIYITYMHLSKKTVDIFGGSESGVNGKMLIENKSTYRRETYYNTKINEERKFKTVNKNDVIGYVGDKHENGGWATHVHIEVFFPSLNPGSFMRLDNVYRWETDKTYRSWYAVKGKGTTFEPKGNDETRNMFIKKGYGKENSLDTFNKYATSRSIMDANTLFNFYDKDSDLIKLKITKT